jgi:hypothetical protein
MKKKERKAGCQRFMTVILATQEAGVKRTAVQSQPGQTVRKTLSQKYPTLPPNCHKKKKE